MGCESEDLKYDYSQDELNVIIPCMIIRGECEFEVRIIHRTSGVCAWSGVVTANSKRGAQRAFREQYSHIRNMYTHEYGLGIRKV